MHYKVTATFEFPEICDLALGKVSKECKTIRKTRISHKNSKIEAADEYGFFGKLTGTKDVYSFFDLRKNEVKNSGKLLTIICDENEVEKVRKVFRGFGGYDIKNTPSHL